MASIEKSRGSQIALASYSERRIAAIRRFNRLYTRQIGLLREKPYESTLSLTEIRVLYELAHREKATASELSGDLELDAGYLSRILQGFERRRWINKKRCDEDGRQSLLALTSEGRKAFTPLDVASREEVGKILRRLSASEQDRLVGAMHTIEELLGTPAGQKPSYIFVAASAGRYGLGGAPAWSALCAGVWL